MADTKARVLIRRGTAAEWTSADPVLLDGEPAWVTDTGVFKIGDGVTTFALLPSYSLDQAVEGKQPLDAGLTSIASLSPPADKILYTTGTNTYAQTGLSSPARTLIAAASYDVIRDLLSVGGISGNGAGIEVGSDETGDRSSFLDLHSSDGVDFNARIIRDPGVNGEMDIQQTGTGRMNLNATNGGVFVNGNEIGLGNTGSTTLSGTTVDFAVNPKATEVDIYFQDITSIAFAQAEVQLGTSGGIVSTGYTSASSSIAGATTFTMVGNDGFRILNQNPGSPYSGMMLLRRVPGSSNWYESFNAAQPNDTTTYSGAGDVNLGGDITTVRFKLVTVSGGNAFNGGAVRFAWR